MRSPPVSTRAPRVFRRLDLSFELLDHAHCCERTDLRSFLHGVAYANGLHAGDEARFEGVVDLVCDEEPFGGDAGLTAVDATRAHGGLNGEVEIGGRHDDERVAAAKLKHGFLDEPAGLGTDRATGRLAAGEGDSCDPLVGEDGLDLVDFEQQGLERASWEACAAYKRLNRKRALRDV